jgi:WD40 repeat protein
VYPISEYEWSPDERYLAVALNNSYDVKIFFVEMPSGKVIDYCIEMDGLLDKFLWGPEGHQLLLLAHENTHAEDVYINLDEPGVYRFDQQSYPIEWFAAGVTSISP